MLFAGFSCCAVAFGQQAQPAQSKAILTSLEEPIYPPLARQASISGEVRISVTVSPDGTAKTTFESGHPMLRQAALDSAEESHFECNMCSSPASYLLVYSFVMVKGSDCCSAYSKPTTVKQETQSLDEEGRPQTRVVLSAEQICLCDPFSQVTRKVRSIKCLYLWKCSLQP